VYAAGAAQPSDGAQSTEGDGAADAKKDDVAEADFEIVDDKKTETK
jgi:hypothetical protein